MSECPEIPASMTGSINAGHLQPQKDSSPFPARSSPFDFYSTSETPLRRGPRQRLSRKMTLSSPSGQPIQLTPLWEHVVRTRKFPNEVDTRLTFLEISERLRDPEWEVRQHALRVLMDVLPTLNADIVDKVMQPVVPELVNNLGHPAPAVRKGALDALRVFLVHSSDRERTIQSILEDGLNRSQARDTFQTNVTTGVILSVPSLLFPSSGSPSPNPQLIKEATVALASRLAQVSHQEAVLKSLIKIRDSVGVEKFENYLEDYDNKLKKNIEVLSKIYHLKLSKKMAKNRNVNERGAENEESERKWDSDSDTSGIAEEEDEVNNAAIPAARVVLETEIKFNEETAITMTILEEKDSDEEPEADESGTDLKNDAEGNDDTLDRRKARRVHFGGEIVKLRTPDSDEAEFANSVPKTRIPLPVSPATKMPSGRARSSSQPCSPQREAERSGRASRSVSNSPKREIYVHNAELSPKKSILSRNNSPMINNRNSEPLKKKKKSLAKLVDKDNNNIETRGHYNNLKNDELGDKVEEFRGEIKSEDSNRDNQNNLNLGLGFDDSQSIENDDLLENQKKEIADSKNSSKIESGNIDMNIEKGTMEDPEKTNNDLDRRNVDNDENKINEKPESMQAVQADHMFGSLVTDNEVEELNRVGVTVGAKSNEVETLQKDSAKFRSDVTRNGVRESLRTLRRDRDKGSTGIIAKNGNTTCGGGEIESMPEEPSWEELGLVGQEVLEDLHNKDDWRARVRGLERVASALRTSSALIAIEPRLGSLLHAVLGCERSCRVAAAGMAVAKVVVAGVSEEALTKRLPQWAWGLARQGGPSAAQLARITMLRIRPALFLEQLLQPQCLNAKNAKTRENTLQLLIFSLVTFPSTEFKVETVANKVAGMVRDRRRRVRQAALDTLAVLAQIYESEEVLAAGKRAAEGHHDGEAMISAIRARLARKSLPLVSADGLVMYGLQISPSVQIATGPDVDWIVAGSGSVSPGIGRSKSGILSTRSEKQKLARKGNVNYRESPWNERQHFVALGAGMRSKAEQPIVWQLVPTQNQDMQCEDELSVRTTRNVNAGESCNSALKSKNQSTGAASSRETTNFHSITENSIQRKDNSKTESRIPVLYNRDGGIKSTGNNLLINRTSNSDLISANFQKKLRSTTVNSVDKGNSQEENVRTGGTMYQQRRKNYEENSTSIEYENYRSIKNRSNAGIECKNGEENIGNEFSDGRVYQNFPRKFDAQTRSARSSSIVSRQSSLSKNSELRTFVIQNTYNVSSHKEGRFADENSFRPLQTHSRNKLDLNQESGEKNDKSTPRSRRRRTKDVGAQKIHNVDVTSSGAQTGEYFPAICPEPPYRRRLRSLSPTQLYHRQQFIRMASNDVRALSMYDM